MSNKINISIIVRANENNSQEAFDKAVNRFKKAVAKDGILREYKDRRHYIKPSAIRHQKAQELKRKKKD